MANQTFKRQIDRIRTELDVIKPKSPAIVLTEPGPDAEPAAIAVYLEQLAQARHDKNKVVVIGSRLPGQPMREQVAGVQYVDSEWEAQAVILAGQPSQFGNKNALDDLLRSLSGNVLGVTANPPPDVHSHSVRRDQ